VVVHGDRAALKLKVLKEVNMQDEREREACAVM
jgi:hypothetical protein